MTMTILEANSWRSVRTGFVCLCRNGNAPPARRTRTTATTRLCGAWRSRTMPALRATRDLPSSHGRKLRRTCRNAVGANIARRRATSTTSRRRPRSCRWPRTRNDNSLLLPRRRSSRLTRPRPDQQRHKDHYLLGEDHPGRTPHSTCSTREDRPQPRQVAVLCSSDFSIKGKQAYLFVPRECAKTLASTV